VARVTTTTSEFGAPDDLRIVFYGVRGSLPAPARGSEVEARLARILHRASEAGVRFKSPEDALHWLRATLPFHERSHYGGDTTSILVRCGEQIVIVDSGTGIRRLGADLMPELIATGRLDAHLLFTHMHLDHVVGFPFFAPLFAPRDRMAVRLRLHGGSAWANDLQRVLSLTVSAPLFPVELDKLRQEAASVEYEYVYDRLRRPLGEWSGVELYVRRLHHPNETYGYRLTHNNRFFVVATDTEPYAGPDRALADLAAHADVLYVDCQFDRRQYEGDYDGVSRVGWGHGFAEWCGEYARAAGATLVVLGHHDPSASCDRIHEIGEIVRKYHPQVVVGFDGLEVRVTETEVIAMEAGERGGDLRVPRAQSRAGKR